MKKQKRSRTTTKNLFLARTWVETLFFFIQLKMCIFTRKKEDSVALSTGMYQKSKWCSLPHITWGLYYANCAIRCYKLHNDDEFRKFTIGLTVWWLNPVTYFFYKLLHMCLFFSRFHTLKHCHFQYSPLEF